LDDTQSGRADAERGGLRVCHRLGVDTGLLDRRDGGLLLGFKLPAERPALGALGGAGLPGGPDSVVLAKSPSGKIERKARLAASDVVDEFLQSISAWRSRYGRGLHSHGRHKVAQQPKQYSFLFTSCHHRQTTFWSLLAEVLEEPTVV
jgi:hypothetical protein